MESSPPFTALSYVWGDLKAGSEVIILDSRPRDVGRSLAVALRHVRSGMQEDLQHTLYLWVDTISINQDDNGEKTAQVRQMGRIYRIAASVLSHLGTETEIITLAMLDLRLLATGWREFLESCSRQNDSDGGNITIQMNDEAFNTLLNSLSLRITATTWQNIASFSSLT